MHISISKTILRDLSGCDRNILDQVHEIFNIANITDRPRFSLTHNIKKLSGFKNYYRIRVGGYRIGIKLVDSDTIEFLRFAPRGKIYTIFP